VSFLGHGVVVLVLAPVTATMQNSILNGRVTSLLSVLDWRLRSLVLLCVCTACFCVSVSFLWAMLPEINLIN